MNTFRKLTKEDADKLVEGDILILYAKDGKGMEVFDETDIENISPVRVESIVFDNIDFSFLYPRENFLTGKFHGHRFLSLNEDRSVMAERGIYWIKTNNL